MADRKISDLTALTTPATGDLLPIVDISEAAAADKNKSITVGELLRGAPDGTAAAPGIAFESDGGNGMFLGGTDILAFSTGGTQAVTIDASQRLGVGTSSPNQKLHVYDSGDVRIKASSGSGNDVELYAAYGDVRALRWNKNGSAGSFRFQDDGAAAVRMFIDSSGNVGVGTTSPGHALTVNGNLQALGTDATLHFGSSDTAFVRGNDGASGDLRFGTVGTERVRIDSSGRVGIGTSSPGGKLEVANGYVVLRNGASSFPDGVSAPLIYGSTGGGSGTFNESGNLVLQSRSDAGSYNICMITGDTPTERMRITSAGNVGVGTTSPGSLNSGANNLVVGSGSGSEGITIYSGNTSSGNIYFADGTAGADAYVGNIFYSHSDNALAFGTGNGSEKLRIDSSGRVGIGTSSPGHTLSVVKSTGGDVISFTNGAASNKTGFLYSDSQFVGLMSIGGAGNDQGILFDLVNNRTLIQKVGGTVAAFNATGVGIGTTSPAFSNGDGLEIARSGTACLRVEGDSGNKAAELYVDSTGTTIDSRGTSARTNFAIGGNSKMLLDSSGRLLVGTSSSSDNISLALAGNSGGSTADSKLLLVYEGSAPNDGNTLSSISFGDNSHQSSSSKYAAEIKAQRDGGTWTSGTSMPGRLVFSTTASGASSPTERMRIQQNGNIAYYNLASIVPASDNTVTLGASGYRWSAVWAANGTIQTSDERAKSDITTSALGSDFIKSLRPVSYKWVEGKKRDTGERDEDGNWIYESVPGERTHWGFIAQEVKQSVDAAGVDFGGWVLTDKDDPDSEQALRYDQFIAPLTKALQEAIAKIETLEAKVAALEAN